MHFCSRSPHGERGLKFVQNDIEREIVESLPAWGAWIEIKRIASVVDAKYKSLPAWGAWIEIAELHEWLCRMCKSLPAWGAWIEIPDARLQRPEYLGRSPHGERGLKF